MKKFKENVTIEFSGLQQLGLNANPNQSITLMPILIPKLNGTGTHPEDNPTQDVP